MNDSHSDCASQCVLINKTIPTPKCRLLTMQKSLELIISVPPAALQLLIDGTPYADSANAELTPGEHKFEFVTDNTRPVSTVSWDFQGTAVTEDCHATTESGALTSYTSIITAKDLTSANCNDVVTCTATNAAVMGMDPSTSVTLLVNGMYLQVTVSEFSLFASDDV